MELEVISTGSLRLDLALKIGGLPRGYLTEIAGQTDSGKTSLCLAAIAAAHRQGETCAYIDSEGSLDRQYAACCGVDLNRLYYASPEDGERALAIAETLVRSGAMAVVVIDSASALVPQAELHTRLGEAVGQGSGSLLDHLLADGLRKLSEAAQAAGTVVIFTNQVFDRPGPVYHQLGANLGRLAPKLHAGVRLSLQPVGEILEKDGRRGLKVQVRVVKNKFALYCQPVVLDIMYNEGITRAGELLDLGMEWRVLARQAASYFFRDLHLGQGRAETLEFLRMNPTVAGEITRLVMRQLAGQAAGQTAGPQAPVVHQKILPPEAKPDRGLEH